MPTSPAIVLNALKYGDSAYVITVYSLSWGRLSCILYGGKKKGQSKALIQPMSIIEITLASISHKRELQTIKEIRILYPFSSVPFHPLKNPVALFLSELLYKVLRSNESDDSAFAFLSNSIQQLDQLDTGLADFHLVFMMKLTRYLGFEPNRENSAYRYFDLMNGVFQARRPEHIHFLADSEADNIMRLLETGYGTPVYQGMNRQRRGILLDHLIEYYSLHIPDFHKMLSLPVLKSLFD